MCTGVGNEYDTFSTHGQGGSGEQEADRVQRSARTQALNCGPCQKLKVLMLSL